MPETFIALPPDSTGKKLRTRSKVIGGQTVHEQAVYQTALPTFYILADAVAFAANKHHLSIMNTAGSGKLLSVKKLFHINLSLGAVTGVALRFDVKRATAVSGGTAITPQSCDTDDTFPAGITINTNGTLNLNDARVSNLGRPTADGDAANRREQPPRNRFRGGFFL